MLYMLINGIQRMRLANQMHVDTQIQATNLSMPQYEDIAEAFGWAILIVTARYFITAWTMPLAKYALAKKYTNNQDRTQRFATVCFKFMYVKGMIYYSYYNSCI